MGMVKQKMEWLEAISGCEQPNEYNVFRLNVNGKPKGKKIFKAEEESGCCARLCLSGECRPFQVTINHKTVDGGPDAYDDTPFLQMDRECKCTCYCLGRPELKVYNSIGKSKEDAMEGKHFLGKIVDPFNCRNLVVKIYDDNGDEQYQLNGSCCQLGIWCKFPCEPCQKIEFNIQNKRGDDLGTCTKFSKGCVQSAIGDADNFLMEFPKTQRTDAIMKALLMCSIIFIDFRFFEENPNKKKDGNVIVV